MRDPEIVDTHCHFNHQQFEDDIPEALQRAEAAGVGRMIVVGYDLESSRAAVRLAEKYASLFAAVGVHPHDARSWSRETAEEIRVLAQHPRTAAIGEIGLDYHYNFSSVDEQKQAFKQQLWLAADLQMPFIIHCREAYPDTLAVLESRPEGLNGVMHCWAGTEQQAQQAVDTGLWLGIGGLATFKNAEEVRQAVRNVPLERIVLETDAPYLAPVPHRGKRNEPAYTALVAQRVADLLQLPYTEIAESTTRNAEALFPKLRRER